MEEPVFVPDPPEAEGQVTFLFQATWPAISHDYHASSDYSLAREQVRIFTEKFL